MGRDAETGSAFVLQELCAETEGMSPLLTQRLPLFHPSSNPQAPSSSPSPAGTPLLHTVEATFFLALPHLKNRRNCTFSR